MKAWIFTSDAYFSHTRLHAFRTTAPCTKPPCHRIPFALSVRWCCGAPHLSGGDARSPSHLPRLCRAPLLQLPLALRSFVSASTPKKIVFCFSFLFLLCDMSCSQIICC